MDPIDRRHYEWQHALHGHTAPPQPLWHTIAPTLGLALIAALPWLTAAIWGLT